jgi:hypothetical protein
MKALGNRKKHEGLTSKKRQSRHDSSVTGEQAGKVVRTFNVANLA